MPQVLNTKMFQGVKPITGYYLENVSAFERNIYLKKIVYVISSVFRIT